MINVRWEDAKAYTEWISRTTGNRYRLLSEAEWEYAARAGTAEHFHFGSTITTDQANYDGTYWVIGSAFAGVHRQQTIEAGSFPANAYGLHDVHGNVWEWVEDCWREKIKEGPVQGEAWAPGGYCGERVLRGGSWDNEAWEVRSAARAGIAADFRSKEVGFRIARTLIP